MDELGERLMAEGQAMRRADRRSKPTARDKRFARVLAQAISAETREPVVDHTDPAHRGSLVAYYVEPSPAERVRMVVTKAVRQLPRKVLRGGTR
ncbi:MAG: hypothetical protein M3Q29_21615 [Chloroflexota bacterium]|nr:hypothetical protein [Chloroflexota bacterium]